VLDAQDQLAIRQLIADRAYVFDEQDVEGLGALFVPDGVMEIHYPGETGAHVHFATSTEIVEGWRYYFETVPSGLLTRTHFLSMRLQQSEGTRAEGRSSYFLTGRSSDEQAVSLFTGVAEWEFERAELGWRFCWATGFVDQQTWFDHPWSS
jgi:hypothetical protein